ncbi:hypothetical protein DRO34_02380 [Candidatus Bathyarchaeota archaeon]|nr:MAG: hypothetical protein DRO34_02380 [Candidatus Bathyarchaeota archaeon]
MIKMDTKTTVKIELVGVLRKTYGKEAEEKAVKGTTAKIRDVIRKLAENSSQEFKRALIDPELQDPRPNTLILVNGREISVLEGLETPVKNGDKIVLISVSHGG